MIKTITFRTDWIKRIRSKALSLKTFKTLLNKRMRMRRTEIRVKRFMNHMNKMKRVRTERSEQERFAGARAHNLLTQRFKAEHRLRLGYTSLPSFPHLTQLSL